MLVKVFVFISKCVNLFNKFELRIRNNKIVEWISIHRFFYHFTLKISFVQLMLKFTHLFLFIAFFFVDWKIRLVTFLKNDESFQCFMGKKLWKNYNYSIYRLQGNRIRILPHNLLHFLFGPRQYLRYRYGLLNRIRLDRLCSCCII